MDCLRCGTQMKFQSFEQLQLGKAGMLFGNLSNVFSGAMDVAVYQCPKCGKIEFFDQNKVSESEDTPKRTCPECGCTHDRDRSHCPKCGHYYFMEESEA